jgi:hypothetical protein
MEIWFYGGMVKWFYGENGEMVLWWYGEMVNIEKNDLMTQPND